MAFDYINEAFKRLDILEEQMFDTSLDGINKLSDFIDEDDNTEDVIRIIDSDAKTSDDIQDSYVGKVIVNCNVCRSHIFENKEDIKIEEDGSVNIEKQCPYCGEQEGFVIVGEIAPFNSNENTEEVKEPDAEISDEEELTIAEAVARSRATRRLMNEDFKEVSITTEDQHLEMTSDENGKVTVVTEPVSGETATTAESTIVPVSDETEQEILANNNVEEPSQEPSEEPSEESSQEPSEGAVEQSDNTSSEDESQPEEVQVDFEEVDEESLDDLGESYLRKVYDNISSFKTTSVSGNDSNLIVEGLITFTSGAKKKTGFLFEAKDVNSRGQLRFRGSNKHFSESADAFSLVGVVDNKKLFVESLKYNYKCNEQTVRGVVRRK